MAELIAPIIFAIIFFLFLLLGVGFWLYRTLVPNKSFCEKGLDAFENEEHQKAKKMFLLALAEDPDSKELRYNLGLTLFAAEEYNEAMKYFDEILEIESNDVDSLYNMGLICFRKGEYANAKRYFEKVLENKCDDFNALFNLALTCQMQKNYEEAIGLYSQALELNPEDADCYFNLSIIEFDQKNYEKAFDLADKARRLNSKRTDILFLVLRCRDEMCTYNTRKEGRMILDQYLQLSEREDVPQEFDIFWARACAKNGELEKSLEICERVVYENRANAILYRLLGLIKILRDELDEARNFLQKAMGLENYDAEVYNLLSYLAAQEGNITEQVELKAKYNELMDDENPVLIE